MFHCEGNIQLLKQSAAKLSDDLRYFLTKNSYLMQLYEINVCQAMNFRLYTIYNKHEMIKIYNQIIEKLQVVLE